MKKKLSVLLALMLCVVMTVSFTSCSLFATEETEEDEFVAATLDVGNALPASEAEIVAFYNDIITKVQTDSNFTAANKPGVNASESINADGIKVLAYNTATGEAAESDALKGLNASAKTIKDRMLSGIDTSIPVIAFGDMNTSISTVIFPYDSAVSKLTVEDVVKAECNADGNNLNISIVLGNDVATIENVFGSRNKEAVLANLNENCADFAEIKDYTLNYVADEESNTYSTINLSVELEKQEDGTYKCTGRITSFNIRVVADVAANATCKGAFADYGDIQIQFRFTDEKSYSFDWMGNATWEPTTAE